LTVWKVEKRLGYLVVTSTRVYTTSARQFSNTSTGNPTYAMTLYALNAANGAQLWHIQYPLVTFFKPLFEINGTLITASDTGIDGLQSSSGRVSSTNRFSGQSQDKRCLGKQ
jgi:outer membrane protein assembly factor BamB